MSCNLVSNPPVVIAGDLVASSVVVGDIASGAIVIGDIASNTITSDDFVVGAISGNAIAANSILPGDLSTNLIATTNLQVGSVSGSAIAAGSILPGDLSTNLIATTNLQVGSVSGSAIAIQSILPKDLAPGISLYTTYTNNNYNLLSTDANIFADATTVNVNIILPLISTAVSTGQTYNIKRVDKTVQRNVTISGSGNIDTSNASTVSLCSGNYLLTCSGMNWYKMNGFPF